VGDLLDIVVLIGWSGKLFILASECCLALFVAWQESGRRPEDRRGLYAPLPPTAPMPAVVPVRVRARR